MTELKGNMMVTDGYNGNDFHSEYVLNVSYARVPVKNWCLADYPKMPS